MANYRSPGVYVEEISLLPPSIAEVESAIPAFVGYTEKAVSSTGETLRNVPTRIESMGDYIQYYGGPFKEAGAAFDIDVDELKSGASTTGFKVSVNITAATLSNYRLYYALKMFYANGGGSCYITSVGSYSDSITRAALEAGLDAVANEDAPTLLLVPEAAYFSTGQQADFDSVNQKMLMQAASLKDRFAILDTNQTTVPKAAGTVITDVNTAITNVPSDNSIRRYGAVYYPYLETSYNYECDFGALVLGTHTVNGGNPGAAVPPVADRSASTLASIKGSASAMYNAIQAEFLKYHVVLPPSAAIAGVIARVDSEKGYWKAPANVGLINVVKPVISISRAEHDQLNLNSDTGKSVNAILSLPGYGTVVMGGRTLDGNDNEWRYVNVRRFFSIVEESVKKSIHWVIFEPNTASTWTKVQAMIENYLFTKWRDGALAGAKPDQAYFVNVGLNKTMTAVDILEGKLIVEIGMAVARPAEFIILRFEHKLQTS